MENLLNRRIAVFEPVAASWVAAETILAKMPMAEDRSKVHEAMDGREGTRIVAEMQRTLFQMLRNREILLKAHKFAFLKKD